MYVALFTGAWIEIKHYITIFIINTKSRSLRARGLKFFWLVYLLPWLSSRSLRARGLKFGKTIGVILVDEVALFTGAWIEISDIGTTPPPPNVALFTGAWIEIFLRLSFTIDITSRSLRARGLK